MATKLQILTNIKSFGVACCKWKRRKAHESQLIIGWVPSHGNYWLTAIVVEAIWYQANWGNGVRVFHRWIHGQNPNWMGLFKEQNNTKVEKYAIATVTGILLTLKSWTMISVTFLVTWASLVVLFKKCMPSLTCLFSTELTLLIIEAVSELIPSMETFIHFNFCTR